MKRYFLFFLTLAAANCLQANPLVQQLSVQQPQQPTNFGLHAVSEGLDHLGNFGTTVREFSSVARKKIEAVPFVQQFRQQPPWLKLVEGAVLADSILGLAYYLDRRRDLRKPSETLKREIDKAVQGNSWLSQWRIKRVAPYAKKADYDQLVKKMDLSREENEHVRFVNKIFSPYLIKWRCEALKPLCRRDERSMFERNLLRGDLRRYSHMKNEYEVSALECYLLTFLYEESKDEESKVEALSQILQLTDAIRNNARDIYLFYKPYRNVLDAAESICRFLERAGFDPETESVRILRDSSNTLAPVSSD